MPDNTELQEIYASIMAAVCAEEVFGEIEGEGKRERLEKLNKIYRRLSKVAHPEIYVEDLDAQEMATEAFKKLNEFYQRAQEKINHDTYGQKYIDSIKGSGALIITKKRRYHVEKAIAEGDISTVYIGKCLGGDEFAGRVVIKIVEDPADNDLMQNEIRLLTKLQAEPSTQSKHLPFLLDQFYTKDNKRGIILKHFDGYDLFTVRERPRYKNGIPIEHVAWMMSRTLSAIGYPHSKDIYHGNINPAHILIKKPREHNILMADWSYGIINPLNSNDRFKVIDDVYSAPEVIKSAENARKEMPTPASDLYSIGKCMIFALGGDPQTNFLPEFIDDRVRRFLNFLVTEGQWCRAQDAWEMFNIWQQVREEVGLTEYNEFIID